MPDLFHSSTGAGEVSYIEIAKVTGLKPQRVWAAFGRPLRDLVKEVNRITEKTNNGGRRAYVLSSLGQRYATLTFREAVVPRGRG